MPDDPKPFDFAFPASPGDFWPAIMGDPGSEEAGTGIDTGDKTKRSRKQSDQSVTSSTTLVNATDMSFPMGVTETWTVHIRAMFNVPGAPDLKTHWSVPSGATGHHWAVGDGVSSRDTLANDVVITGSGGGMAIDFYATIIGGSIAGTAQFQFAQFASDAASVTMYSNAVLIAEKIT